MALNYGSRRALLVSAASAAPPPDPTIGTPYSAGQFHQTSTVDDDCTVTLTAAIPAGQVAVVWAHGGSGNAPVAITDSKGNTWVSGSVTISSGTRRMRGYYSFITNALGIGDTVGVNFGSATGVKVVTVDSVAISSPTVIEEGAGAAPLSTDPPPSITASALPANAIVFGAIFVILGSGDTFTPDTEFTALTNSAETAAGGGAMHTGAYKPAGAGAVTYNPTLGTARDSMLNYFAFKAG